MTEHGSGSLVSYEGFPEITECTQSKAKNLHHYKAPVGEVASENSRPVKNGPRLENAHRTETALPSSSVVRPWIAVHAAIEKPDGVVSWANRSSSRAAGLGAASGGACIVVAPASAKEAAHGHSVSACADSDRDRGESWRSRLWRTRWSSAS